MNLPSSCKCLHCREFFIPCPNSRHTQRYCAKPECRKASKAAAQAKWLNKAQIVPTFADRKTSSGCNAGESAIPVTGAKRDRYGQMRYKILPPVKYHKISRLRLMRSVF